MQKVKSRFQFFLHWLTDLNIFINFLKALAYLHSYYLKITAYFKNPWHEKLLGITALIVFCFYVINLGYISYKYTNLNIAIRHVNDGIYFLHSDCANNPNDLIPIDNDKEYIREASMSVRDNVISLGNFLPLTMMKPLQQYILTGYQVSAGKNICTSLAPNFNLDDQRNNLLVKAHSILNTSGFYEGIFTDIFHSKKIDFYLPGEIATSQKPINEIND